MQVEPLQLVQGCILLKDVVGKTNHPIIKENTVLTEEHILILKKFLIKNIDVSTKLASGETFKPVTVVREVNERQDKTRKKEEGSLSFTEHYNNVVSSYKRHFNQWQNNNPIDMPDIRKLLIPLFERVEGIGIEVYKLHRNITNKKDYLYHHSISLGILSAYLAKKMGYEKGEWLQVGLAGFLSNVGMAKVNPHIIEKSQQLTYIEWDKVKKHPHHSYQLVESLQTITKAVKLAVLQHHERLDGSGYPLGLTGKKIHIYARIIAVCDTYHSMTSERLYEKGKSIFRVMNELKENQFTMLDPQVVQVFIQNFTNLAIGEKVELSSEQIGKIIFIEVEKLQLPMIQLLDSQEIISLENERTLYINDLL